MKSIRRVSCAPESHAPGITKPRLLARLSDLARAIRRKKPSLLANKTNVPPLKGS
jgi:hypothetical protein